MLYVVILVFLITLLLVILALGKYTANDNHNPDGFFAKKLEMNYLTVKVRRVFSSRGTGKLLLVTLVIFLLGTWLLWETVPFGVENEFTNNQDTRVFRFAEYNLTTMTIAIEGHHDLSLDQRQCSVRNEGIEYNAISDSNLHINTSCILDYEISAGYVGFSEISIEYWLFNIDMILLHRQQAFADIISQGSNSNHTTTSFVNTLDYTCLGGATYYISVVLVVTLAGLSDLTGSSGNGYASLTPNEVLVSEV